MFGNKSRCNEGMGGSRVEQNCRKGRVNEELTKYYVRCLLCFLSVNVIDAPSSKGLRRFLLGSRCLLSSTSNSRCGSPHTPAGVSLGWCSVLVLFVGAVGDIMANFSAVEAGPIVAHSSTCPTIVVLLLIRRTLASVILGLLVLLRFGSLELQSGLEP